MVSLTLDGTKVLCPRCYDELKTGVYERIIREWDPEESDLARRDFYKLFNILTSTDQKIKDTPENDATIWNAVGWYVTEAFKFSAELPKVLEIDGKKISIPRKVGALGSGQNIILRQRIQESKYMEENISIAVAIMLQPLYDNSKFNIDSALELEEKIREMPIYLTHPVGFFFLQTAGIHGAKPTNDLRRILGSLKRNLKRMLPRWRRSESSGSLTTYRS